MKIINIDNKEQLDNFVGKEKNSQFLQSWEWGEFQEKVSGIIWRIGVEDGGKLICTAKIIKKSLPMGKNYFYCGRGPIFLNGEWNEEAGNLIFNEIKALAKNEMAMFLRFDPTIILPALDFTVEKTLDIQPSKTLHLNLEKSEDDLLKEMHQKTRYNIRLAEKKGIKMVETNKERFDEFWQLLDQTAGRDKFRPHGISYYKAMLDLPDDFMKLFFIEDKGKALACGIFSFFGDTATYLHGGSASESRNLMAPFLLQWEVIKKAKASGFKFYDFHGIDEKKWSGVTRFKKGFGGEEINYPGTFDMVYDEGWYQVYKMIRKVRRSF